MVRFDHLHRTFALCTDQNQTPSPMEAVRRRRCQSDKVFLLSIWIQHPVYWMQRNDMVGSIAVLRHPHTNKSKRHISFWYAERMALYILDGRAHTHPYILYIAYASLLSLFTHSYHSQSRRGNVSISYSITLRMPCSNAFNLTPDAWNLFVIGAEQEVRFDKVWLISVALTALCKRLAPGKLCTYFFCFPSLNRCEVAFLVVKGVKINEIGEERNTYKVVCKRVQTKCTTERERTPDDGITPHRPLHTGTVCWQQLCGGFRLCCCASTSCSGWYSNSSTTWNFKWAVKKCDWKNENATKTEEMINCLCVK